MHQIIQQKLSKAIQFHTSGKAGEAEQLYREIIQEDPNNAEAYYLWGLLASQFGNFDTAIMLISRAIELKPSGKYYASLGNSYFDKGDINAAIDCYLKTIELDPKNIDAYNNLGMAYTDKKMFKEAINCYQKAIEFRPGCTEIYNNLGVVYHEIGEANKAIECLDKAIKLKPNYIDALFNLGNAYKGNSETQILAKDPEAIDKAISCYQKVLRLKPDHADAYINLGMAYFYKNDPVEEMNCYKKAVELRPDSEKIYNNLGNICKDRGDLNQAVEYFKKAVELKPDYADAYCNLGVTNLTLKNFEKGWDYYQWRLSRNELFKDRISKIRQPVWDGSSVEGKTIYVYFEQGFGDTINFVRYLPMLNSLGAKVLFRPQKELESLLKQSDLRAEIIDNSIPDEQLNFDFHIPLMSLPYFFRTNSSNIPCKIKYLNSDPEKVRFYKENYFNTDKFKLGINWQCKNILHIDNFRSIPDISCMLPFTQFKDVKVYSFQKGCGTDQLLNLPEGVEIVNLGDTFNDFSDTAAALENLDLLISVDTSVPHLSGALGKNTWVLLQYIPDWRWFLNDNTTPWYESVRLFRQKQIGNWQEVIDEAYQKFKELFGKNEYILKHFQYGL